MAFFVALARPVVDSEIAAMSDDLEDAIRQNAQGPAKASGDTGSVEQHSLTDQIAADRYLSSKAAANFKSRGLRFNKLVPPRSA